MAEFNLGRILPSFKGTWNNSITYSKLDIVLWAGSSWVAKQTTTNNEPSLTDTINWQLVAASGELSGNLTPAQEQAIINSIINQAGFVSDSNYIHTDNNFTDGYKTAIDNIGNGTLTIQRNSTNIGTFSANQSSSSIININVPTYINQLQGSEDIVLNENYISITGSTPIIDVLKTNAIYEATTPLTTLKIIAFQIDPSLISTWVYPETYIFFTTGTGFILYTPARSKYTINPVVFEDNADYMITVKGAVFDIKKLY